MKNKLIQFVIRIARNLPARQAMHQRFDRSFHLVCPRRQWRNLADQMRTCARSVRAVISRAIPWLPPPAFGGAFIRHWSADPWGPGTMARGGLLLFMAALLLVNGFPAQAQSYETHGFTNLNLKIPD